MNIDKIPFEFVDKALETMNKTPWHTYLILTKRPCRMKKYFCEHIPQTELAWPLPNVWIGVTCENQEQADKRIPILLQIPASVRWVSCEPLLGPIDLGRYLGGVCPPGCIKDFACSTKCGHKKGDGINWCVTGGESGPGARPCHPDWIRSLRDQCQVAGVPYFFKQHGEWEPFYDRDMDDSDWQNVPDENAVSGICRLNLAGGHGFHGDRVVYFRKVGKKAAGRLLDGREWDELPGRTT